ncbi:zinc finger protein 518B [Paralichthys olivaceus]|uniref:zinc finger protein 518B n=1 Tax=Paralichthys olivaceus TaxID=8255 RepID=UPI00097DA603|nr:PREDICTED: uncharacterized protein LOC109626798 [Paralichthys olivaceus]XP_019938531.1 PREDICTED: uncharacterized protein LOC109626798 [Paralichthys olivaceus]XP_019938543.1 PREDICTED: uncharacterized protein LOC109626813 [Paralichthys olivaceus]
MTSSYPVLDMKPVSYQSLPSSVSGGHQDLALDRVLSAPKVMYCEKCGFASMDVAVFKKHMVEHMTTRFYCFYCNDVSFSEAELKVHLKQHTSKYPFTCPHCGQGYMRRLCLVKHIERLHSKSISQGPAKPGMTLISPVPVSSALSSVSSADPSPPRPTVKVTVPALSAPVIRLDRDEQRGKTLDTIISNAANGNTELLSPLNGLIQHNRALTVSLPEEVTIPAGCLVELVEVKTVNGTKELKLRLVSQQENESVIKDTRTTVCQSTTLGKPLTSTLNHQSPTMKTASMGMCTVNRKQCETKTVNVERPAVVPVSISKNLLNQSSKEKSGFKRKSQEIINLECNTVIPNKIPKTILSPVREGNSGMRVAQREPLNAASPTVILPRLTNRLTSTLHPDSKATSVSQRAAEERMNLIPEPSKSIPAQRASDTKSLPRNGSVAVKLEPGEIHLRNNTATKIKKEGVGLNQQHVTSGSVPLPAASKVKPPAILSCKDNVVPNQSFPAHRTLTERSQVKTSVLSNHTKSKISAWTQEVRSRERAGEGEVPEPESFPIISSVFSLSQQPGEVQGSIQPLVMALRGIVMDKSNSSGSSHPQGRIKIINGSEQVREAPTLGFRAQVDVKDGPVILDPLPTERCIDSVKVEGHKGVQHPPALTNLHIEVKEEKNIPTPTDTLTSKSVTDQGSVSEIPTYVDASVGTKTLQQVDKTEHDISKFLTVSLRRVQVGVWKKNRKGLKLRISKYKTHLPVSSVADCAVIYPMPLKEDQLVKRPGPNQPVVVLNHPKPRAPVQGLRADTIANTGASEVVPKCQILKMRLSKVVGQKYEVMGCTVRVFP